MTFLNPLAFLGLLSLPVIVYLHLLRERHRRSIVSNLDLWSFLDHELRGPRRKRIPLSWLLILDLLVATLLALAWSQPRLSVALPVFDARHHIILIDISTSMRARIAFSTRFEAAKSEAISRVERAGPQDVVTVLAFGSRPHWVGDSRRMDRASLIAAIQALEAGETGPSALPEALALGQAAAQQPADGESLPVEVYLLTDGAYNLETALTGGPGSISLAQPEPGVDSSTTESADPTGTGTGGAGGKAEDQADILAAFDYPIHLRLFGAPDNNTAVLDLKATPLREGRYGLFVRLVNFGVEPDARIVSLYLDDELVDSLPVQIPAGSAVPQVWQLSADSQRSSSVKVALSDGDSLEEDDFASIGLRSGGSARVLLVAETPAPLQQAFAAVPGVELRVLTPSEYNRLGGAAAADLVVFRGSLPESWPASPVLVVDPPQEATASGAPASILARSRTNLPPDAPLQVPVQNPLLTGIDFSGVRWAGAWALQQIPAGFNILLQAAESPLLLRGSAPGQPGMIWVLLADLNRGNFVQHPAFPVLIANLVEMVRQGTLPASVRSGEAIPLPPSGAAGTLHVAPPDSPPAEFSDGWPAAWEHTLTPGLYSFALVYDQGPGELAQPEGQSETRFVSGVNAGDLLESDLRPRPWAASGLPGSGSTSGERTPHRRSIDLAPWLLAAALALFFVEAILAWKRKWS